MLKIISFLSNVINFPTSYSFNNWMKILYPNHTYSYLCPNQFLITLMHVVIYLQLEYEKTFMEVSCRYERLPSSLNTMNHPIYGEVSDLKKKWDMEISKKLISRNFSSLSAKAKANCQIMEQGFLYIIQFF